MAGLVGVTNVGVGGRVLGRWRPHGRVVDSVVRDSEGDVLPSLTLLQM